MVVIFVATLGIHSQFVCCTPSAIVQHTRHKACPDNSGDFFLEYGVHGVTLAVAGVCVVYTVVVCTVVCTVLDFETSFLTAARCASANITS